MSPINPFTIVLANIMKGLGITIGYFDALHRGHQRIFSKLLSLKEVHGLDELLVVTFDISPKRLMRRDPFFPILSNYEKEAMLKRWGLRALFLPFLEVMNLEPREFLEYLFNLLKVHGLVRALVIGEDFRFGRNRRGGLKHLRDFSNEKGILFLVVEKLKWRGGDISTSRIKRELLMGNLEDVNEMLGYNYFLWGEVKRDKGIGASLGFPTANISIPPSKHLPKYGVYISRVWKEAGGEWQLLGRGLLHIGPRLTFGDHRVVPEVWIEGFHGNLYGERILVELLRFLRPTMTFESAEKLKERMLEDSMYMRDHWNEVKSLSPWWEVKLKN